MKESPAGEPSESAASDRERAHFAIAAAAAGKPDRTGDARPPDVVASNRRARVVALAIGVAMVLLGVVLLLVATLRR